VIGFGAEIMASRNVSFSGFGDFRVRVTGSINNGLVSRLLPNISKRAMDQYMDRVIQTARTLSPYKTGYNRSMISGSVETDDSGFVAVIETGSGYGGYLEFGTWKMEARPYIMPALDAHKVGLGDYFRAAFRSAE
jgi:HK97 gp10 family phage protein